MERIKDNLVGLEVIFHEYKTKINALVDKVTELSDRIDALEKAGKDVKRGKAKE